MTTAGESVQAACVSRLEGLCDSMGLGDRAAEVADLFRMMTDPWGAVPAARLPGSDVSSDGSPVEFAADIDDAAPSVQFAVEPMTLDGEPAAAARRTMAMLATTYDACADRWAAVADLFLPARPCRRHVAMYGAEIRGQDVPAFKVWFYPGVHGHESAPDLVAESLARVGLAAAWPIVRDHAHRGFAKDVPILFSLDLTAGSTARTRVYFRHYDATVDHLAALVARSSSCHTDEVAAVCYTMTGGVATLSTQAPVTCLSFSGDSDSDSDSDGDGCGRGGVSALLPVTLYIPLWIYADNDEVIRQRVRRLLRAQGQPADRYERALERVSRRPLAQAVGIHNYLGWQARPDQPRVKIYWSPELRHSNPAPRYRQEPAARTTPSPRSDQEGGGRMKTPDSAELVVVHTGQTYQGKQGHTFFAGISRQSAGSQALCLHLVIIPPGASDRPHLHEDHESAIYVISGRAEGRYGPGLTKRITIEAGDFVYIPAGVAHQPANASTTEPLVAIIARTDPDEQESVVLLTDSGERQ